MAISGIAFLAIGWKSLEWEMVVVVVVGEGALCAANPKQGRL